MRNYIDTGAVRSYFLNFQFLGPDSVTAGIAGECAYEQNPAAFWNYKTYIYRLQGPESEIWATPERLLDIAREYVPELDINELETCLREQRYEEEVEADRLIGQAAGVQGTPTVFVDGTMLENGSYPMVQEAIEAALARTDDGS